MAACPGDIAKGRGRTSANRARSYLSGMLDLRRQGIGVLERNVLIGTQATAARNTRDRVLTENELRAVWQATDRATFLAAHPAVDADRPAPRGSRRHAVGRKST